MLNEYKRAATTLQSKFTVLVVKKYPTIS